jgi:hypothetical protein
MANPQFAENSDRCRTLFGVKVILQALDEREVMDVPNDATTCVRRRTRTSLSFLEGSPCEVDVTYEPHGNGLTGTHEGEVLPIWVPRSVATPK